MRFHEIAARPAVEALNEAPQFADLTGRDGLRCRVWRNPVTSEFSSALRRSSQAGFSGLRAMLTETDLYVWQSVNLLHADFERDTGITGVRVALRAGRIEVNDETVALPDQFPFIFGQHFRDMEIEDRRKVVEQWLRGNQHLKRLYPDGFPVSWYM